MSDLVERWKCSGCGSPSVATERTCNCPTECLYKTGGHSTLKGAAFPINQNKSTSIAELEAEVERLRSERAQLSRGINMAMGCLSIFRSKDEKLAWYRLYDVASGKEPRSALNGMEDGKKEGAND